MSLLTLIILVPLLAALAMVWIPRNYRFVIRLVALAATLLTMLLAAKMFIGFSAAEIGVGGFRYIHRVPWVESLGIQYFVGVDGIAGLGLEQW